MTDNFIEQPTRRDRWGRYLVVPPDGNKPVGYTRATTIAKTLDDTSSLMSWAERMTAIGLSRRPDILAQIGDAENDKTQLNRLCELAKEAGGATIRRDLGTALHSMLEHSITDPGYTVPPAHADDIKAVHRLLAEHGLTADPDMCERIVVNDQHRIAGTFDLLLRHADGRQVLADFKTGTSIDYSGVAFSTQLTIYANADSLYRQGVSADGSDDVRELMPNIATDHAYIIHCQPGSGVAILHRLTLDIDLLDTALKVRDIRKRRDLLAQMQADTTDTDDDASEVRDLWIRARIDRIRDTDRERLALRWPADTVPTPKKIDRYTNQHINLLIPIIDDLETINEIPFPDPDPDAPAPAPRTRAPKPVLTSDGTTEMPDEGELTPEVADQLKERFTQLNKQQIQRLQQCTLEAKRANLPIRVADNPTARRCNISRILFHAVERDWRFDDLRGILAGILDIPHADVEVLPFGAAIGLLNHQQADSMAKFVEMGETLTTREQPQTQEKASN